MMPTSTIIGLLLGSVVGSPASQTASSPAGKSPARQPDTAPAPVSPRITTFQPGVRINWTLKQVEVDATVILRRGPIELFACSPRIREHEAIVRIEALPMHLFQALGLIGLAPGHPVRWLPDAQQPESATGDPVEIDVRWRQGEVIQQVPIETWMRRSGQPPLSIPGRLPWVFAGSLLTESGAMAVDTEGTVIAVVDFASALIALPEHHSERNEELWLEPDTARIPPVKTRCELLLRSGPLRIRLEANGRLQLFNRPILRAALARAIRGALDDNPNLRIEVNVETGAPKADQLTLAGLLGGLGLAETATTIVHVEPGGDVDHQPEALAAWLHRLSQGAPIAASGPAAQNGHPVRHLAEDLRERGRRLQARLGDLVRNGAHLIQELDQVMGPEHQLGISTRPDNASRR